MTENKRTPAPWYKLWNGHYWDIQDSPTKNAPSKVGCIGFTNEANANIAAAAPELLEALEELLFLSQRAIHYDDVEIREPLEMIRARGVIAKVKGES